MAPASVRGLTTDTVHSLKAVASDSGGGGGVHEVQGRPDLIAKIIHTPVPVDDPYTRRLKAVLGMRLNDPRLVTVVDILVSVDDPKLVLGVLMKRVNGYTLYSVTNPDERRLLGITLTAEDRLRLATEVARAFAAIHALLIVFADAHHRNVMVTFDANSRVLGVVLIEPDTLIFEYRSNGRMEHFTSMARLDFLPPEFQTADLRRTRLTVESDRFALVLLVCLALFDCTPQAFAGSSLSAEARIQQRFEWLTPNLPQSASAPDRLPIDPAAVPDAVMSLLRKGLSDSPKDRPDAASLAAALEAWSKAPKARVVATRFVSALATLKRARTLAQLRQRVVDAFFAALRNRAPSAGTPAGDWWTRPGVKLLAIVAVVGAIALWAVDTTPPAEATNTAPKEPTAKGGPAAIKSPARGDRHTWKDLLKD